MHVAAGSNWEVFMTKLYGRFARCKLLVVIITVELYKSKVCLREIHAAARGMLQPKCWADSTDGFRAGA